MSCQDLAELDQHADPGALRTAHPRHERAPRGRLIALFLYPAQIILHIIGRGKRLIEL